MPVFLPVYAIYLDELSRVSPSPVGVAIFVFLATWLLFVLHAYRNNRLPEPKRRRWVLLLELFPFPAQHLYWWWYIRKPAHEWSLEDEEGAG